MPHIILIRTIIAVAREKRRRDLLACAARIECAGEWGSIQADKLRRETAALAQPFR